MKSSPERSRRSDRPQALISFAIFLTLVLASCATLPDRLEEGDRYLALVVENGGMGKGGADVAPYLLSNLSDEPLRLKSGINFVKVPASQEPVRLRNLNISTSNTPEPPLRSGYLGYEIKRPDAGTIVLVAKKLRYLTRWSGPYGQVVFETSDLDEKEVERILRAWNDVQKKEPNQWLAFEVARPETVLF